MSVTGALKESTALGIYPLRQAQLTGEKAHGGILNMSPTCFRRIRSKIGMVRAGAGSAVIVGCPGDSIGRGTGAGAVGSSETDGTGGYNGILNQIATQLTARGITANCENVFGYGGYEQAFSSFDNRITVTGSFNRALGGGFDGFGGQIFQATTTGTLKYAPVINGDTIDLYYLDNGAACTYQIDAGSTVALNTTSTSAIKKATISLGSVGAHNLQINWVSGTLLIVGFNTYTAATTHRVDILNGNWHGSRTDNWVSGNTGSYWNFDGLIGFVNADLVIYQLAGSNDWSNSIALSTFLANTQTLLSKITALTSVPDILMVTPPPRNDGTGLQSIQQQYIDGFINIAITNGLPVYDRWRRWGGLTGEAAMETFGVMNADHIHPTRAGYVMDAQELINCILG